MVYNVQPRYRNTLRWTYAAINMTPVVSTVEPKYFIWTYRSYEWDLEGRQSAITTH